MIQIVFDFEFDNLINIKLKLVKLLLTLEFHN